MFLSNLTWLTYRVINTKSRYTFESDLVRHALHMKMAQTATAVRLSVKTCTQPTKAPLWRSENAPIRHVLCKANAQLSLKDHNFHRGPKAFDVPLPLCVHVRIRVRACAKQAHLESAPPSLQYSPCRFPGQSSIKPMIAEGGPGYTLS